MTTERDNPNPSLVDATPQRLMMARRIAAHALCGPEKWKPGVKAGIYEEILRGDADAEALVQGPLAAIIETTEAAAKIAETLPIGGGTLSSWINTNESPMGATRRHIATAIRSGGTGEP